MSSKLKFNAVIARQSDTHQVVSFPADAMDVFKIARIERAGRDDQGDLFGFQRPQVSQHILEIRDYLKGPNAVLPNSVVLAFVDSMEIKEIGNGFCEVSIDITDGAPGLIVDGQQRLTALEPLKERDFQVFVSAILCSDDDELRKQFILINNTRPLPKELIYELLPTVDGLPHRLSSRAFAAHLTTKLNYYKGNDPDNSAFWSNIRQHTNPTGTISSTAVQKVIMNSRSNGAIRELVQLEDGEQRSIELISNFYGAMMDLFPDAWVGKAPRHSRLKHSSGITALGFVMEVAYTMHSARTREDFREILACLRHDKVCAWTSGTWYFSATDIREWDKIQNTSSDLRILTDHLVRIVRDQSNHRVLSVLDSLKRNVVSK